MYLKNFKLVDDYIKFLKNNLKEAEEDFFEYLKEMTMDDVEVKSFSNNSIVFPHTPIMSFKGPLIKVQLIESSIINFVNYSTLMSTLAATIKMKFKPDTKLYEIGSKHSQSTLAGLLANKYTAGIGIIDKTSNIQASKFFDIPLLKLSNGNFISDAIMDDIGIINMFNNIFKNSNDINNLISDLIKKEIENLSNIDINDNDFVKIIKFILELKITDNDIIYNLFLDHDKIDYNQVKIGLFTCFYSCAILLKKNFTLCINIKSFNIACNNLLVNSLNSLFSDIRKTKDKLAQEINNNKSLIFHYYNNNLVDCINMSLGLNIDIDHILNLNNYVVNTNNTLNIDIIFLNSSFIVSNTKTALGLVYKLTEINNHKTIKLSEEISKSTIPGYKTVIRLKNKQNIIGDILCFENDVQNIIENKSLEV